MLDKDTHIRLADELDRRQSMPERHINHKIHRTYHNSVNVPYEITYPVFKINEPKAGFESCVDLWADKSIELVYRLISGSKIYMSEYSLNNDSYSVLYEFVGYR